MFGGIGDAIGDAFGGIGDALGGVGDALGLGGIMDTIGDIGGFVGDLLGPVQELMGGPLGGLITAAFPPAAGIMGAVNMIGMAADIAAQVGGDENY